MKTMTNLQNNREFRIGKRKSPELVHNSYLSNYSEKSEVQLYMRAYRKQVQLPILYETSIFESKTPQRCLTHNIALTLFCVEQNKPLCVQCIKSAVHKCHTVTPLNKSMETIQILHKNTLEQIQGQILPKFDALIEKSSQNLQRVEKQMGSFVISTTKIYNDLNSLIASKKKEHLQYYQHLWNKYRKQYSCIASQLSKANQFYQDQIKSIIQRKQDDHLLFNFNVSSHLSKVIDLLPHLGEYHPVSVVKNQVKMNQIAKSLYQMLNFDYRIIPEKSLAERSSSLSRINSKQIFEKMKQQYTLISELSQKKLHLPLKTQPIFLRKQHFKALYTSRQYPQKETSSKTDLSRTKYHNNSPGKSSPEKNEKLSNWIQNSKKNGVRGEKVTELKSF